MWQWNGVLHKTDCITFTKHLYIYAMTGAMPDFSLGAACTTSPFLVNDSHSNSPLQTLFQCRSGGQQKMDNIDERTWSEYKTSIQAV